MVSQLEVSNEWVVLYEVPSLILSAGNMSDPKVVAGKEGSFKKSVLFFQTHL